MSLWSCLRYAANLTIDRVCRPVNDNNPSYIHITGHFSYDTTSQSDRHTTRWLYHSYHTWRGGAHWQLNQWPNFVSGRHRQQFIRNCDSESYGKVASLIHGLQHLELGLCIITGLHIQVITFEFGQTIVNTYDNSVTSGDEIVVNIEAYISNDGDGLHSQVRSPTK